MNDIYDFIAKELIDAPALVSITGGGGKTTLMCGLAERLARENSVVATTTTKIEARQGALLLDRYDKKSLIEALETKKPLLVGRSVENDKLLGFNAPEVDEIFRDRRADFILVEADGAKRMPFKAYADYEPVVPSLSTLQIIIIGAEAFVLPASEEIFFRFELTRERWKTAEGERLPLDVIITILESKSEYLKNSPPQAKRLLLVNKCDILRDDDISRVRDALASGLSSYDCLMTASLQRGRLYSFEHLRRVS